LSTGSSVKATETGGNITRLKIFNHQQAEWIKLEFQRVMRVMWMMLGSAVESILWLDSHIRPPEIYKMVTSELGAQNPI